jgi:hypothetical protein
MTRELGWILYSSGFLLCVISATQDTVPPGSQNTCLSGGGQGTYLQDRHLQIPWSSVSSPVVLAVGTDN